MAIEQGLSPGDGLDVVELHTLVGDGHLQQQLAGHGRVGWRACEAGHAGHVGRAIGDLGQYQTDGVADT